MKFKFSRCVALQVPDRKKALTYYRDVLGLEVKEHEGEIELGIGPGRLFLDESNLQGPVLEFLVSNIEEAKSYLLKAGCETVLWEGTGGCCYIKDPFGVIFNLYEETGENA